MIRLKSPDEIQLLREGGKRLSKILQAVASMVKPGITTEELNEFAENEILMIGGEPSFKGYGDDDNKYPCGLCTSVNQEVVHGIPCGYILKEGDILSLDIGMRYPKQTGLYTDMAFTVPVGKIDNKNKELIKVTKKALGIWLRRIKPGVRLNEIAKEVQEYVERNGFSVVRDLVGHGVGHSVHEEPQIPNYYIPSFNTELKEGMVLALEPMVCIGDYLVETEDDGWTVSTKDGLPSAHFEHTVAVTKKGNIVITK